MKLTVCHQQAGKILWFLTTDTIKLFWQGSDFVALSWLIKESFQLDNIGLIHLARLDNNAIDSSQKVHNHKGMCAVFLRHNQFYQAGELVNTELEVEEKSRVSIQIPFEYINILVASGAKINECIQNFNCTI